MEHGRLPGSEPEVELLALRQRVKDLEQSLAAAQEHERTLQQQVEDHRNVLENLQDVIFTLNTHGTIVYISPAMEQLTHYALHELLGQAFSQFVHPDDQPSLQASLHHTLLGHLHPHEFRIVAKDHSIRHVRLHCRPQFKERQIVGITGIITDISAYKQTQEDLQTSERRYRSIFENATVGIFRSTPTGRFLTVNPTLVRMLGYDSAEETIASLRSIADQGDAEREHHQAIVSSIQSNQGTASLENRYRRRNGEEFTANLHVWTIRNPQDTVLYIEGIVEDITERKRTEEALRDNQRLLQSILDYVPAAIYVKNRRGRIVLMNRHLAAMLNLELEQAIGKLDLDLFPPAVVAAWQAQEQQILASGKPVSVAQSIPLADGLRTYLLTRFPIYDDQGEIAAIGGMATDITAQKRAEEALRASQALLQSILDNVPAAVYVKDLDGRYMLANRFLLSLLDRTPEQLIGKSTYDLVPPEVAAKLRANDRQAATTRQPVTTEEILPLSDGPHTFLATKFPLINMDGQVYATGGISTDITERKRTEEALRKSEEQFRALFEQAPVGIGVSRNGITVMVNTAYLRMFGYSHPAELIGHPITECIAPAERQSVVERAMRRFQGAVGESQYALTGLRKDGSLFPTLCDVSRIVLVDGQPASVAFFTDITERKGAEQQIERQLRQLHALREIDLAITASLDLRLTLSIVLSHVLAHLHVDAATVLLLNPATQTLDIAVERGFRSTAIRRSHLWIGEGYAGRVIVERQPITIPDLHRMETPFARADLIEQEDFSAYYGLPLIAKGQVRGVLELFHRGPFAPTPEDLALLESLAGQAAIAINNAELFDRLQRTNNTLTHSYDATIEGWAHALELRDAETEGHSRRVTDLTLQLAQLLDYSDAELIHIRRGAILHDIGKMAIPDSILLKPGPLTEEEWAIMRQHPVYAYQLLAPIPFLRPALDIPYYHHEKWDGTGYPHGLKGEDIPLSARIFALVDVWDALCSDRPYRKGWALEQVRTYIREQTGKHFDPQVACLFLEMVADAPRAALAPEPQPSRG